MSIIVTGATGHFGRLAVESLLNRGVPAGEIVAVGRDVARLTDLAERGVVVRPADYEDRESLTAAFAGAEKVLLVSGNALGRRVAQHANAIEAAKAAGAGLLVYTSSPNAATASYSIAAEHRATEELVAASGLPYVILRNGWYLENYTGQLPVYVEHGIVGAAGDGRIAGAARADLAEAAAVVLTTEGHAGHTYELGGEAFTMAELAAEVSRQVGREIGYTDLPEQRYVEVLVAAGVPQPYAAALADSDRAARDGELYADRADLEKLLGRRATPLADALRDALGASPVQ
jgi:NAD(P)H dehydrogenase (quinone)